MARRASKISGSEESHAEARRIAVGIQQPGQTKAQTKLIAQGIQKGIEQYRKQQKAKQRDADKHNKQVQTQRQSDAGAEQYEESDVPVITAPASSTLPWVLLLLTWIGIGAYFAVGEYGIATLL